MARHQNPRMLVRSPHKRDRPRGLWKARVMAPRFSAHYRQERKPTGDSTDDDSNSDDGLGPSSKRLRSDDDTDDDDDEDHHVYYWDYSRRCSPYPDRLSSWETLKKTMDTSSTAVPSYLAESAIKESCDYEDWEDLKELFAKAADQYENNDASEALPILRGVIHECHRFLIFYEDPSEVYLNPSQAAAPRKCKCVELPTAFYVILGTTLFLFGNLIAQEPSLALDGEPAAPVPYWLAAIDVFETGENLPARTNGLGNCDIPEDWRMAVVWGRTLICLTDEIVNRSRTPTSSTSAPCVDNPAWPPDSPFAAIAARRPPLTYRISLADVSTHELLVLAMDQFSRGIFHMPHPLHMHPPVVPPTPAFSSSAFLVPPPAPAPPAQILLLAQEPTFSRAKELFTIASEVLLLAEKLPEPAERATWAAWADSVFTQMRMEADMDAWRTQITRARGRCWLAVGSARIEELEAALERGELDLLHGEDAKEAREGLGKAVEFFERARGSATGGAEGPEEESELGRLLAEALLTLGNLEPDEEKREEFYRRALLEGGEDYFMGDNDDEKMDET
ncbi:hypothetical protein H0H81_003929 [Sphagnurus paluster]|uniref:Uncharacterized protein n=1 Tax=Sphagnurus paluster TaxID=117069 RepID=A0A9P7GNW1_9AGAR|nr:hypothetical protein H0H81_003929 [Sphagnurus paluster]